MKLAILALTAALLIGGSAALAQEQESTVARGTAATPTQPAPKPREPAAATRVDQPQIDPNMIIDVFNRLTRPRPPAPPPPPLPDEPIVREIVTPVPTRPAATVPPPPRVVPPPPRGRQPAPTNVAEPRPSQRVPAVASPPPPLAGPTPVAPPRAPAGLAAPAAPIPPAPAVLAGSGQAIPAPVLPAPVVEPFARPAQRSNALLSPRSWFIIALLAVAAAAAGAAVHRARRIARTRGALSLDPRLDLAEGACAVRGGSLACPPMTIRTRLEFAGA